MNVTGPFDVQEIPQSTININHFLSAMYTLKKEVCIDVHKDH